MAKYSSSIHYKISTSLDASGITKLQAELNKLEHELTTMSKRDLIGDKAVTDAISDIRRIENALDKAFSPRLGMMNTKTFMSELTKGGRSLTQIYKSLGPQGTAAFAQMYGQLGKIDTGMKSVSKTTDKMFNTLGNTVRWGVIASGFQYVLNSAHAAVQYMADLDESLTNIRMVTDESKESMREFAQYANEAAKSLGNTTVAYTDAALIYAQQGYDLSDQKVLANYTLKVANATGQETGEVSEQMTALINGFQLSVEDVGSALDVMAKIANTSAADLEELATAASKVASTANTLGVTQEQLTAQIATIVSVTREAPENVGNALKTIYARFGDLKLGETLEDGTDLGKVSSTLQKIGVQVLDSSGAMRDMGLIMEDLMAIWDTLDTATKQGAAVTLAGKYQYNRLMALMENSDMYEGYYDDAINSAGTLEEMQSEYMESLEGKANALKASFEGLLSDLFNQDDFGPVIEGLTEIVDLFDQLIEAVGGGGAALTAFGAIGMNVFSNQIGRGISNIISNREKSKLAEANVNASITSAKAQLSGAGLKSDNKYMQQFVQDTAKINQYAGIMSDEQIEKANQGLEKRKNILIQLDAAEKQYKEAVIGLKGAFHVLGVSEEAAEMGLRGFLQTLEADGIGIEEAQQELQKLTNDITNMQTKLVGFSNLLNGISSNAEVDWEKIHQSAESLIPVLRRNEKALADMGVSGEQLTNIIKSLDLVVEGEIKDFQQFSNVLNQNNIDIEQIRSALIKLSSRLDLTDAELEKIITNLFQYRNAAAAASNESKGFADILRNQSVASHFANMTSGAMSLVFAMQSLKSLGSIWANEDLELGEKISQTLMNGTMTVAMLAMAYVEMSNAMQTLMTATKATNVVDAFKVLLKEAEVKATVQLAMKEQELALARGEHIVQLTEEAVLEKVLTEQKEKEVKVTDVLKTKLKGLKASFGPSFKAILGPAAAAALAIAFIGYRVTETKEKLEALHNAYSQQIENSSTALDVVDSSNFEELYKNYQETNHVSEELKTSSLELAEALGIVGASALVEQGNFTLLNQEIQTAIDKHKELLNTALQSQNQLFASENTGFNVYQDLFQQDFQDEFTRDLNFSSNDENIIAATGIQYNLGSEVHGYSFTEQVGKIYSAYDAAQKEVNRLTEEITANQKLGIDTTNLEKELATQQTLAQNLGALIANEDYGISTYKENVGLLAENALENLSFEGLDYTEALSQIIDLQEIKDYYTVYGQEAGDAFVQAFLASKDYGLEVGLTQLQTNLSDEIIATNGAGTIEYGQLTMASASIMQQLKETENLSEEEKIQLINLINWDLPVNDILANIKNAIDTGSIDNAFISEENVEDDSAHKQEVFSKYEISEESADAYEEQLLATTALGEEQEVLVKALSEAEKQYGKNSEEAEEARKQLEKYSDTVEDMAVDLIQSQKGLEELTENFEENYDVIKKGEKASYAYSEAISSIKSSLADVLNISADSLSNTFIEENLENIKRLVDGDLTALNDLRAAAGQEIAINISKKGNLTPESLEYLKQKAIELNALSIDVNANLDDTAFIDTLNTMIYNGEATAAEITEYLEGIGYEPTITTVQKSVTFFTTEGMSISTPFGDFSMPHFSIQGMTEVPVIDGGSSGSGGFSGYTPSANGGLKRKASSFGGVSSPASSGGGGGGGGGGSSYEPKTEEHLEEEPDRYQDVNAHLDRLSNNLEKVADEQDRLTGKALLDNMQKQVDLIQEQTDWHQKKLEIQQQEAAELREELNKDYGLTFDANGYIENYETVHQQLIDEYNALVDEYNAATTEEAQEAIKERMDDLKEKIDAFNEGWERYDELMNNEIPESIKTLEDLEDQIEDIRIEAFNAAVEAADNIKEVQDAWAEYMGFMSGLHPDSPFRALTEDAMKYENALDSVAAKQEDLDNLMKWLPQYQPGGVITSDNPFGENSAEFYEALQTAYQSYIEAALEAEELYYQQIDDIIEGYDDIADRIEKRMENYARLTEQLDHYASVIETLYGEEDYDNLLAIKRANQDVLESSIEQQRANLAMWQNELAKYNKETQPEIWEAIHEKVVEAEDELNGLVEEAAENTAAILEMAVDKTVKEWKDTMLGGDADWMETQWELIKQNADQYLDTVEETYELEKLRSKYNSLANDTADLNLRKRINDQMEKELAYLKEKDKLSEYDVNYANAKLEILQKQIALEEAQANKNQMKLRRDSQGNYSYVYTANQDDVENARNDLLDSEFNAYSMSKENYLTNYDNYIAAISAAAEQIKAINADTMLSEEEKAERTQWIYDNLKQYLSGIAEQIGVSEQGMLESVKYLAMDSSEIVGQNYADIAAMMEENWTEALGVIGVAVSEEFDHIIHNMDEFLDKTQEKWKEFEEHTQEWADNVNDIADDGTDGFRDIDDVIIDINNDMKELNEETEDFFALVNDDLGTIDKAVGKLADYEKQLLGLKESTSKVRAELETARAEIIEKENEIRNLRDELQAERNKGNGSDGDNSSGSGGSGSSDENKAAAIATEALEIVKGVHYGTISNGSGGWRPSARKAGYSEDAISIALKAFNDSKTGSGYSYYYDRALELVKSYDTGGYTGVWGKEGRLAMLHQKELVLNASDTSNILAAVSAIREIVSVMKADSIGSMLSVGRNSNIAANTGNNIQQNVEIYADFPAAESAAEIKAALEGLAQQAIQYSMRTR